jgi:hypothetical protein
MEMFDLLERFGLPVMMVIALGLYAKSQTAWIQDELQKELRDGKGDKQRVRWSKDFAKRFNLIFNNKEKKTHGRYDNSLSKKQQR